MRDMDIHIKVKKQLVVRKDIDINVHERHGYKCT